MTLLQTRPVRKANSAVQIPPAVLILNGCVMVTLTARIIAMRTQKTAPLLTPVTNAHLQSFNVNWTVNVSMIHGTVMVIQIAQMVPMKHHVSIAAVCYKHLLILRF